MSTYRAGPGPGPAAAATAEAQRHHPELLLRWGRVRVALRTNKIKGLSEADFVLAAKYDRLYRRERQSAESA